MTDRYLKPAEVADIRRTTPNQLKWERHVGRGPAYIKSGRLVLYPESALYDWLESGRCEPLGCVVNAGQPISARPTEVA